MTKPNYRRMVYDDIPQVVSMMEDFFYMSKLPSVGSFDTYRVASVLEGLVPSDKFFGFVAVVDNKIVGLITAHITPSLFEHGDICSELVWWVSKEYRGTTIGLRLFYYMEEWAKFKGCSTLQVGGAEGYSNVENMYLKLGFTKIDSTYWRKL